MKSAETAARLNKIKWLIMRNIFFSYQPPKNMSNMGDNQNKRNSCSRSYSCAFDVFL